MELPPQHETAERKKLYERLFVSRNDLNMARQYAQHLLKKGWHSAPYERRGSIYMQQSAFVTALVVSYARPFTRSHGWRPFPNIKHLFCEEEKRLHQEIIDLRNEVYSHSDSCRFKVEPFQISDECTTNIYGEPFRLISQDDCIKVIAMIDKITEFIAPYSDELQSSILRQSTPEDTAPKN